MLGPMAELEFELEYAGPALDSHEMDAKDFATAVLNAAELFKVMNSEVHPYDPPVSVNIRAVNPGSFDIVLKLLSDTEGVLASTAIVAGANLSALVQIFIGIIRLARYKSRSRLVDSTEVPGGIRATFEDGTSIEFPAQVLGLSESYIIRHNINEIVRPVDGEGIESVSIKQEEVVIERVDFQDVESLSGPPRALAVAELVEGTNRELWLDIVSPTFKEGNAWRFSDGGPTFMAKVTDQAFLDSIEGGEPFRKGDRLRCILNEVQWTDSAGTLKNRREVITVLDHVRATFQPRLMD